tara:strand:+ start:2243 stop:2794 length:552 start_codon:yes stop_codon:yes gene_type:complete
MADYINVKIKKQIIVDAVTTASSTQLIAAGAGFQLNGVVAGDVVYNITSPEFSTVVTVVDENTITLNASSTGFSLSDNFVIMSPTLTEDYFIKIDSITRATIENVGGLTRIALALRVGGSVNQEFRINLKNAVSSGADSKVVIDQFMRDVNTCLASSYTPNFRNATALPDANEYMYASITTLA